MRKVVIYTELIEDSGRIVNLANSVNEFLAKHTNAKVTWIQSAGGIRGYVKAQLTAVIEYQE